jgi:hypothetical protein
LRFSKSTDYLIVETTMKLRMLIVLVCTALALSACIVEPYGGGGVYVGGGGDRDYGRRVWR